MHSFRNPSRRQFLQVLGAGAAALGATPLTAFATEPERPVGYCVIGLGRISLGQFMPGVRISNRSKLVAVVSGNRAKAEKVAAEYQIPASGIYSYDNLHAIADNPAIDAVYVALPNGMHAEYTIRAAQAGKHVLCEKPMANSPAECEQMIAACRKAGRKLMVAYRCRYEPTNLRAISLIRQGALGKLQEIQANFGFDIGPTYTVMGETRKEWRLDHAMAGGGPMVDVGIYCLQAARYLSGEEPTEVSAQWSVIDQDGRFKTVEENLTFSLRFPSGVLASCSASYGTNSGNWARANGSRGWFEMNQAFMYDQLHLRGVSYGQGKLDFAPDNPAPHQFATEADYFSGCIRDGKEPLTGGAEGLRDGRIIHAIYQSCREKRAISA